ncbi:MAG TPA: DEAD/DEAH box helicase [Rhizobiales bacterium]|nr:DEAD/DEAH box helicase [Hyphomicrobiales bacterium]
MTKFAGLNLAQPVLRAVSEEGYETPTPIQSKSIAPLIAGRDLLGVAQTGTGKTAAFALPLLHRLAEKATKPWRNRPRVLILAPTRELAGQIGEAITAYGRHLQLKSAVVFGGVSIRPQIAALSRGVHIVVATPGRLIDLMNQGHLKLDRIEMFILDEADRMLDMGFIHDVRKISAALPKPRQTVLFSATMPKPVKVLADGLLNNPVHVEVAPAATTAEKVEQSVYFVAREKKLAMLSELMADEAISRVLVFTRTKHRADRVTRHLKAIGVEAAAIHGNKSQNARQRALKGFQDGKIRALVATDIAARGIDVDAVTHVINFEIPNEPETYVHRIGRTARAGAAGIAISLCDADERAYLRDIEKTIRQPVPVIEDQPFHDEAIARSQAKPAGKPGARRTKSRSRRRPGGKRHKGAGNNSKNRRSQRPAA